MPNLNASQAMGDQLIDKKTNNQSQLNHLGEIKEVTGAFFTTNMLSNENCNKFSNGLIWQEDLINNNETNSRTTNHSRAGKLQKTHFNENKTQKMSQISDKKQSETPIAKNYNIDFNDRQMLINEQSNSNIFSTLREANNNNTPKPGIKTKQSLSNSQNFSHVAGSNHHYYMAAAQKLRNFGDDDPSVAAILPMIQKN